MKLILINWIGEGLLVILSVYLLAIMLRSALSALARKKLPFTLAIAGVFTIYTAITWVFYYNYATPLSAVFSWFGSGVLVMILIFMLLVHSESNQGKLNIGQIVRFLKPAAEFFILFVILAALYSVLIVDKRLPIVIYGNNDVWGYGKFTHLALNQPSGNNVVDIDLLKNRGAYTTPTALMLLAGLAHFLRKEVVDILGLGLILVLTLGAFLIKELCLKHWKVKTLLAYLIAIVWISSSFSFYLASNYFLAQWLGICIFLASILVALGNEDKILIPTITLSLLNYLMLMTYPGLFFPCMVILLFLAGMESAFSGKNLGAAGVLFSIPAALGITGALNLKYLKATISHVAEFSSLAAGWPLGLLNPFTLIAIPVTPIDSGALVVKVLGYFVIFALAGYLIYRANKTKTLSAAQFALSSVFILGLVVYLFYYGLKGNSYQQWKFAGSVVLPLSFLPMVGLVSALGKGKISTTVKYAFLIAFIGLNLWVINKLAIRFLTDLKVYAPLRALVDYDQDLKIENIAVDLKDDHMGTMIAAQFINQKPLTLRSRSYYSKEEVKNYLEPPLGGILLTNNCSGFNSQDLTMLGNSFYIIRSDLRLLEKIFIKFNKPLSFISRTSGLSIAESWGRWSDGYKMVLEIPVKKEWKEVELKFKGMPFLAPGIERQRMFFSVHGKRLNDYFVSKETVINIYLNQAMFDDGYVELTIDLPDAQTPSKFGSIDQRVLAFAFYSLEIKATGNFNE